MDFLKKNLSLIAIVATICFAVLYEFTFGNHMNGTILNSGWEMQNGNGEWTPISYPCMSNSDHSNTKLLKLTLPEFSDGSVLFITGHESPFTVSHAGKTIYSFPHEQAGNWSFFGFPPHSIETTGLRPGDSLDFRLSVNPNGIVGFCQSIYLESKSDEFHNLLTDRIERTLTALIAISLSLYALLFSFSTGQFKLLLYFSGFALSLGVWTFSCVSGPYFKHYLIRDPVFWAYLDLCGIYLSPPFIILFFNQIFSFRSQSRIHRWIMSTLKLMMVGYFMHAVVITTLSLLKIVPLSTTLIPFDLSILLFLILIAVDLIFLLYATSCYQRDLILFSVGFFSLVIFGIHDVFVGIKLLPWKAHLSYIGINGVILGGSGVIIEYLKSLVHDNIQLEGARQVSDRTVHDIRKVFSHVDELLKVLIEARSRFDYRKVLTQLYPIFISHKRRTDILLKNILDVNYEGTLKKDTCSVSMLLRDSLFHSIQISKRMKFSISVKLGHQKLAFCNKEQIERVFTNLFMNAVKALPKEGGRLWIETSQPKPDRIGISIGNNGDIIEKSDLVFIFTPNFRISKDGHGLGLRIIKKFVSAHDGTIKVSSSADLGTVFTLDIPSAHKIDSTFLQFPASSYEIKTISEALLDSDSDSLSKDNELISEILSYCSGETRKRLVYVIDDDVIVRSSIKNYILNSPLEKIIELVEFDDPISPISVAAAQAPDLILCDLDFGSGPSAGEDFLRSIKNLNCYKGLYSLNTLPEKKLSEFKIDCVISKPVEYQDLLKLFLSAFKRKSTL